MIIASNDINEEFLHELSTKSHALSAFGIGTNLVTCQAQPALGCVYKLVECKGQPRIKLSQELAKVTLPGRKRVYRLSTNDGEPFADVMTLEDAAAPQPGERIQCYDPSLGLEAKIENVTPALVEELHSVVFEKKAIQSSVASLTDSQAFVKSQLRKFSKGVTGYGNPTRYPVYVSTDLYQYLRNLWTKLAPRGA